MFKQLLGGAQNSKLIDSAFEDVSAMLDHSSTMLDLALASLLDNQPLEVDLEELDDEVDNRERAVRRRVLEHLSLNPERDLVPSLILVSLVQDAERIGDFARGLAELAPLAKTERGGPFNDRLKEVHASLGPLFEQTKRSFLESDVDLAKSVVHAATENKRQLISFTKDVAASDLTADMAVVYASSARILRRIGSHLSNICSSVSQPYDRIRHDDEEA